MHWFVYEKWCMSVMSFRTRIEKWGGTPLLNATFNNISIISCKAFFKIFWQRKLKKKTQKNLPMQPVLITTNIVTESRTGEVYWIQHYVISLSVTYDRLVVFYGSSGFLHHFPDRHEIIDILLKVASTTITPLLLSITKY